jgi:magnesium chelatase family protein
MSLAVINTRAKIGLKAPSVSVEVHLSNGLPAFNIVGLPEAAVKESKDRVRSAIINSHFEFPNRRITVNLAPAELPKGGSRFDLPIAIGILAASDQLPKDSLQQYEFIAELALSGELRGVEAILPSAIACAEKSRKLVVSKHNIAEASIANPITALPAKHLLDVTAHLYKNKLLKPQLASEQSCVNDHPQLNDVIGQNHAKRALEIAATGGHHLLLFGPPGAGKSMLARRLPGILPPMTNEEALQTASIHSLAKKSLHNFFKQRPFRSPHHSASTAAMVGGGSSPQPGEISLAHQGVLFLDELPEFQRSVIEALREPLEGGEIHLTRAAAQVCYPAQFQLVAAMNPCPCGYMGSKRCQCSIEQINRYHSKLSGPILDRIDLHVRVNAIANDQLLQPQQRPLGESSETVLARVCYARDLQLKRQGMINAQLSNQKVREVCPLDNQQKHFLNKAITNFKLSTRSFYRLLKVARSIADIESLEIPDIPQYQEALSYRSTFNNSIT